MNQIIEITPLTMKRLLNYQRVTENNAHTANKHQWIDMTLENMRHAEKTRQAANHIRATVAYAGYLFKVQNQLTGYRQTYCDGHLHNALVALMDELAIAVDMVIVDDIKEAEATESENQIVHAGPHRRPLYLVASNGHA